MKYKYDEARFAALADEIGRLYEEFCLMQKDARCPVAPNDHVVGVVGEWRAIEYLRSHGLMVGRASERANDKDDLLVSFDGEESQYVSVKTTTEHSKTGNSGKVGFDGFWQWMLVVRLSHDLRMREIFWLERATVEANFKAAAGGSRAFSWKKARSLNQGLEPSWLASRKTA